MSPHSCGEPSTPAASEGNTGTEALSPLQKADYTKKLTTTPEKL
jgi:hypothetical protein